MTYNNFLFTDILAHERVPGGETLERTAEIQQQAAEILKTVFGYHSFRDNQLEVITAALEGRDVFTSMPTGAGKSLCYQIPGLLSDGVTVIISPLIALMKDQVDEARALGIPAACLNSSLSGEEISGIYSGLYKSEYKLLYLSPERLAVEGYFEKLRNFNVTHFAIDEAHCLSEWGHDFRPDYLVLSRLRSEFPGTAITAFTATATKQVQNDILRILKMRDPLIIRASFNRKELNYLIRPKTEVLSQISAYIKDHPGQPGIVYRFSRKDVEKTVSHLKARGCNAVHYHAGLTKEERTKNQDLFNNDEADVIVATTAFGMGIHKDNIRFVIHGDLPKSMEGYYQETGRAGRDGLDSDCVLFFSSGDIVKQQYFIDRIEDIAEREKCAANLKTLVRFASVHVCRRKQILEHFDEVLEEECGRCDVCCGVTDKSEATVDAQKILSAVARTGENFGANHIIDIVRGADTQKIRSREHHRIKTYGVGRDKSKRWWRNIVDELIGQEKVYMDSERFNVLCITDAGKEVLYGKEQFFITEVCGIPDPASLPDPFDGEVLRPFDKNLFRELKSVRTRLAKENSVPPYIVFSDKTLSNMVGLRPRTQEEFLRVSGVGEKKLEAYGDHFLSVIREYGEE